MELFKKEVIYTSADEDNTFDKFYSMIETLKDSSKEKNCLDIYDLACEILAILGALKDVIER